MEGRRLVYRYAVASSETADASLLEVVWEGYRPSTLAGPHFRPPVDIVETEAEIVVTVEIAGVPEDRILIAVRDHLLSVTGERPWTPPRAEAHVHRSEIRYGTFRLAIELPEDVVPGAPRATSDRGLLRIRLPRARSR